MTDDSISDDDKALFNEHMRHVKPLKNKKPIRKLEKNKKKTETPIQSKKNFPPPSKQYKEVYLSDFIREEVHSESSLSWSRYSLPRKQLYAFERGELKKQGRLDLHGCNADVARTRLTQFIDEHYEIGHRCLLIIHGKGGLNKEAPVLKNLVNTWLPQLEVVLAFHSAQSRDGGTGAVYVLLKRKRET